MIVVCNAGPLIALGKLGQLGLLQKLFGEVVIAREVYREVVVNGRKRGYSEAHDVEFLVREGALRVVDIALPVHHPLASSGIDSGEIETVILAQRQKSDWVLIDDRQARLVARRQGLAIKGTLGILLGAWRAGFLSLQELELSILRIKSLPELWISETLCDAVLRQARQENDA